MPKKDKDATTKQLEKLLADHSKATQDCVELMSKFGDSVVNNDTILALVSSMTDMFKCELDYRLLAQQMNILQSVHAMMVQK